MRPSAYFLENLPSLLPLPALPACAIGTTLPLQAALRLHRCGSAWAAGARALGPVTHPGPEPLSAAADIAERSYTERYHRAL